MAEPIRLTVTTPWYPGANNPFAGVFVQHAIEAVQAVEPGAVDVTVIHAEDWATPADPVASRVTRAAMRALTRPGSRNGTPVQVREGRLLRVRVPSVPGRGFARHAQFHVDAVRRLLPGGRIEADVVHAHEGLFGGLVATRLTPPGVPVVITEHDTRLRRLVSAPDARALYGEVIERSAAFCAVSEMLARQVSGYVPGLAHRVSVLPNAVAFDQMPMREAPVAALRRWLYVGRLAVHKGTRRLVNSFVECARTDPGLTLTIIGSGVLRPELEDRVARAGLADRVAFLGPVPHAGVREAMATHDLLVHLSERETFGMTVMEAVATGLPVIATRSGGPQETLAGLEDRAGRLVPVGTDPDGTDTTEVVDAYRSMVAGLAELDLPGARAVLEQRYGRPAVGRRLLDLYRESIATREAGATHG